MSGTTYIFLPPLKKPTGGLAVLHRIAAHLQASGREVRLAPREPDVWRPETSSAVPETAWQDLKLGPEDIWFMPEGWAGALTPGLKAGAKCVIYCQSWIFLFSGLPEGVEWGSLNVSFLAVSDPVALYIRKVLGIEAPVLRPGIDLDLFAAPEKKPGGPVRVAYMPRKNNALTGRIRRSFEARAAASGGPETVWEEIRDLPRQGVAEVLKRSHIFLATGFPEGCPLPPLEAMACGCLPVGFAGFGGFDYMRNVRDFESAYSPWWQLEPKPWSGNGLFVSDADVLGAALALETAVRWVAGQDERYLAALAEAAKTAGSFGLEEQQKNIDEIWNILESDEPTMSSKHHKRPEPESLGLAPVGVETHAHLDLDAFDDDLDQVVERARNSGVALIGQVFLGPAAFENNRGRFDGREGFFYLLGVHPHDSSGLDAKGIEAMRRAFKTCERLKAVGEIGLDYFYDNSPQDVQRQAFRDQLIMAKDLDKPVVIHSRDADEDTLTILEEEGFENRPLLWHCFGRDAEMAARLIGNGWLLSIPGAVTFRKSEALREAVAATPIERLVIESDCPFLTPEPYRGKRNEPAFCVFTAAAIAEIKGLDVQDVWRITAENARTFFGL